MWVRRPEGLLPPKAKRTAVWEPANLIRTELLPEVKISNPFPTVVKRLNSTIYALPYVRANFAQMKRG